MVLRRSQSEELLQKDLGNGWIMGFHGLMAGCLRVQQII